MTMILNSQKNIKFKPSDEVIKENEDLIIDDNENFIVVNKESGIAVQGGTKSKKNILDNTSIIAIASSYGLALFITQFMNPYLRVNSFFDPSGDNEFVGAASVLMQAFICSYVFVYVIRFKPRSFQIFVLFFTSFGYLSIFHILGGELWSLINIIVFGSLFSYLTYLISKWYYNTNNERKMQISAALVSGSYGLVVVLYILYIDTLAVLGPLSRR